MSDRLVTGTDTITVVIPSFNRSALLQRAVDSVLRETRVPIRVHVFDNASTDDTQALMHRFCERDDRVRYTRNPSNLGGLKNYQIAIASVSTAYFVPLADDDHLLDGFLYKAHAFMQRDRSLGATIFYTEERDEDGRLKQTWPNDRSTISFGKLDPVTHLRDWMRNGHYAWSSILWRADVLAYLGPPFLWTGLPSDVDFQAQVFARCHVELVNEPGAVYSAHPGQASRTMTVADLESWLAIFERLDRQVVARNLFGWDEYQVLRQTMWNRYRGVWNIPADGRTLSDPVRMAALAGFRLGDWALAFQLAAQAGTTPTETTPVLALPDPTDRNGQRWIRGGRRPLMLEAIRWFQQAVEDRAMLAAERSDHAQGTGAADAAANAAIAEAAALSAELDGLRRRCLAAEAAQARLAAHPFVRALSRLGLVPAPGRSAS